MVGILLLQTILAATLPLATPPLHKFADGYIDRSVSVVVRDQVATIEFSAGMNDATMRKVLDAWRAEAPGKGKNNAEPTSIPKSKNVLTERSAATENPARDGNATSAENTRDDSGDLNDLGDSGTVKPGTVKPGTAKPNGIEKEAPVQDEFVKNDAQLIAEFQKLAAAKLLNGLNVICQNKALVLKRVNADIPVKRHMSLTIQFEFALPTNKSNKLSIFDKNFQNFDGAVRYSLKGMGNAILASTNVPPILVRAKRVELAELNEIERREACTIEAHIVHAKSEK